MEHIEHGHIGSERDALIADIDGYFERTGPSLGRSKKSVKINKWTEYTNNTDWVAVERAFAFAKQKYGLKLIISRLNQTTRSSIAVPVIAMNVDRI